jgi:probable rRNA maturation factor
MRSCSALSKPTRRIQRRPSFSAFVAKRSAPARQPRLSVSVTDGRGRPAPAGGLGAWLARHAPRQARGRVTIALVSDTAMRRLNRRFRGKDYATDVLSFPGSGPEPADLGEIAIARGVARRQARKLGHSEATERRILALHGVLHLLGYDHEADRGEMERLEERLRRRAGLPAALIARAARAAR